MGKNKKYFSFISFLIIFFLTSTLSAQSLSEADSLINQKQYTDAITILQNLKSQNPDDAAIQQKLDNAREQQQNAEERYANALQSGLQYFNNKQYDKAKDAFETALSYKPDASYPALKLEEINRVYKDPEEEKAFEDAMARADELMNAYNYQEALKYYNKALELKPRNVEVLKKVKQIKNFVAKQEAREEDYRQALENAATLFAEGYYERAMLQYQEAALIKPDKNLPKNKIEEIRDLLSEKREIQQQYEAQIAVADSLYMGKQFDEAKLAYQEALEIKPSETYPVNMISKIDPALARQESLNTEYLQVIEQADLAFKIKDYDEAKELYRKAMEINPAQTAYPRDKIDEINMIAQERESNYEKYIAAGDSLFEAQQLAEARIEYEKALKIFDKPHPNTRISTINNRLAEKAGQEERYARAIEEGDKLFDEQSYALAAGRYRDALNVFPEREYPAEKLDEIENLLAEAERKQAQYDATIARADSLYKQDQLVASKNLYQDALEIMEKDYPQEQINAIDRRMQSMEELAAKYNQMIAEADQALNNNQLSDAKSLYQDAANAFSDSTYPKEQISKVEELIAQRQAQKERQQLIAEYQSLIQPADSAFDADNLALAKSLYQDAANNFSDSTYPKEQISKVEELIAQRQAQKERQQLIAEYQSLIQPADSAFNADNLALAKSLYTDAANAFSDSTYPREQISKVENLIAQRQAQKERQQLIAEYQSLIQPADSAFDADDLALAKSLYRDAANAFSDSTYPKEQISKVEELIAQRQAQKERQQLIAEYQSLIQPADSAFDADNLALAKSLYQDAANNFSDSTYPKEQISKVEELIAKRQAQKERQQLIAEYQSLIQPADSAFDADDLALAKSLYQDAANAFSDSTYPKQKLEEVDNLIAQQEAEKARYEELISKADASYNADAFKEALSFYQDAEEVFPDNPYPKKQISAINDTLAAIESRELSYKRAVNQGDSLYDRKEYQKAIQAYQRGLDIFPGREHPTERVNKSMDLLAAIREKEKMYSQAIATADSLFEAKAYEQSITSYEDALQHKPKNPYALQQTQAAQDSIDKREADFNYAMAQGNTAFGQENYKKALANFKKAKSLKPENEEARERVNETSKILEQLRQQMLEKYNAVIAEADRLYKNKALSRATDKYEEAAQINPEEEYPEQMIAKIKEYLEEHSLREIVNQRVTVAGQSEKKFEFEPLAYRDRTNNFIVLTTKGEKRNTKIFLNYGMGEDKQGGVVIPSITTENERQYIFNLSDHRRWKENDINWISVYVQGSDIEITGLGVSKGD